MKPKVSAFVGKGGIGKSTLSVLLSNILNQKQRSICVGIDQQENHKHLIKNLNYDVDYTTCTTEISEWIEFILESIGFGKYKDITPIIAHDFVIMCSLSHLVWQNKDNYNHIVLDMPPNHSTIDMLYVPDVLESTVVKVLTLKKRIKKLITGHDETLERMELLREMTSYLKELLVKANFYPLGIPTELGLLECVKAIETLMKYGLHMEKIIVNMVNPYPHVDCNYCHKRYSKEEYWIREFEKVGKKYGLDMVTIPYSLNMDAIELRLKRRLDIEKSKI